MSDSSACLEPNGEPHSAVADQSNDSRILVSWAANAEPWTAAVREGQIASRRLATDQAVIDAVAACAPQSVLDIGCGEGWLVRALSARGIRAAGVDAIPALIAQARQAGPEAYYLASYQDIAQGKFRFQADTLVCNFSLFGKSTVETLFAAFGTSLPNGGRLIVQTLHPLTACGDLPYCDSWRIGSWQGFGPRFIDPPPWYFRTLSSWLALFTDSGFEIAEIREPSDPNTHQPLSILFVATVKLRPI
ncbi:methyltransferase domain-containing protein [Methylomonas sp. UP202]|uniref:class I SAM-dependent methyltransferase n=1 Tax=Methylomonas sp. UP202 TaxID=3040943 RepID=UPI002478DD5D|nr:methyltransferase domain-containing protein [Methylomonas sp. UP202]WGS83885.1 methyltransferase domain-containing protein [Methylomonas sp. UP202]